MPGQVVAVACATCGTVTPIDETFTQGGRRWCFECDRAVLLPDQFEPIGRGTRMKMNGSRR